MTILSQEEAFATPMFGTGYFDQASQDNTDGSTTINNSTSGFFGSSASSPNGITQLYGTANTSNSSATASANIINNALDLSASSKSGSLYYINGVSKPFYEGSSASAQAYLFDTLTFHNLPSDYHLMEKITIDLNFNYGVQQSNSLDYSSVGASILPGYRGTFSCPACTDQFFANSGIGSGKIFMTTYVNILSPTVDFTAEIGGIANTASTQTKSISSTYLDPSITVLAPPGITFTSASGATYSGTPLAAVPEPSTWLLFGIGLMGFMAGLRRHRHFG